MEESNKTFCKMCKQLRVKIADGYYPSSRNKRYKDEEGKLWNGKVAPCCHGKQVKVGMRRLRNLHKLQAEDKKRIGEGDI